MELSERLLDVWMNTPAYFLSQATALEAGPTDALLTGIDEHCRIRLTRHLPELAAAPDAALARAEFGVDFNAKGFITTAAQQCAAVRAAAVAALPLNEKDEFTVTKRRTADGYVQVTSPVAGDMTGLITALRAAATALGGRKAAQGVAAIVLKDTR